MPARYQEISQWFDKGVENGAAYMIVVCDTFDHDEYPVYVETADDARERKDNPGQMQRVMEVYDLNGDKSAQMEAPRAMAV